MHIVLFEPEIPQNVGNVARSCVALGVSLHLIRPLGFKLDNKYLKRAGLDYWSFLDLHIHTSLEDFLEAFQTQKAHFILLSTKASVPYHGISYAQESVLIFGKESAGLPHSLHQQFAAQRAYVPTTSHVRSLNLANTVAVVAFEAFRQLKFPWNSS